ncbi:hypothetical protein VPH35_046232 [Triticum aestivum]|uniref:ELM2 domain-containing protein n=2 Tax=Triticum TaxID=4564 RepID=A0A9R0VP56_TRITD|nr:uncharacterized protein LOC123062622 [Triticum aestivum]VAH66167.1 unnamed protein product [Triticum turgidum subsp. durum]
MVGMYQKQLLDAPFALNGHCADQPRHAPAAAAAAASPSPYPPNPSSSSGAAPSPHAQADGAGQPRRLFHALVGGILQRGAGGGNGAAGDLGALVSWAREVAVDPCAKRPADRPRKRQVLALRRARYLKMEDVADQAELPSFSKKRKYRTKDQSERPRKGPTPTRKSERLARRMVLMTSVLLTQRKKIGVGEQFQAEIPDWTGPPSDAELSWYRNDPNTSKMLGSRTWPPEGYVLQTNIVVAGQGRPESCNCPYPGNFYCRLHHINTARDRLRSEIGQVFTEWKFDLMGEQVSKMWSIEEQLKFAAVEQLVPVFENKSFWAIAAKHFASKTRVDLVRYYLNVFLMRRVSNQCRLSLLEIDSDEDEAEEEEDEDQSDGSNSSQRPQDVQEVKKIF